jgi:hypothetical protein
MRNTMATIGALAITLGAGSAGTAEADGRKLFLDVHELGKGAVTAAAVAEAHRKDLAAGKRHGVDYKAYWLDEKEGKVYCLVDAPSAEAAAAVHREAHGLMASKIMEVVGDNDTWAPTPGKNLYMDVHHLGAGKVTAQQVAGAHQKDLAAGPRHDVNFLNYWFDAATGTVMCLVEAPTAAAAVMVHREAHGLLPATIERVAEGR